MVKLGIVMINPLKLLQQVKMKELWDNKEDESWERAIKASG